MSAKEEIMGRIRRALSDTPAGRGEEAPVLERPQRLRPTDEGLTGQFRREMEKLGGRVVEADSEPELNEYIDGVLGECTRVAVSDVVSMRLPGICNRLRARGIEIVPSLGRFASPRPGRAVTAAPAESDQESLFQESTEEQAGAQPGSTTALDLMERYKVALFDAGIGITTADYAIADTGTLVLLSEKTINSIGESAPDGEQHRLISLVPPIHVCLLDRRRIVANLTDLLSLVHKEFYLKGGPPLAMTFISGPSRTADIELTLTRGVHGPREVHVLLCGGLVEGS